MEYPYKAFSNLSVIMLAPRKNRPDPDIDLHVALMGPALRSISGLALALIFGLVLTFWLVSYIDHYVNCLLGVPEINTLGSQQWAGPAESLWERCEGVK